MTAYFLATETLEEIKFKRDTILGNTVPGSGDEDSWIGPELLGLQTSQGGPAEYFDWDKDGNDFFSCNDSAPGRCPYLDFDSEYGYMYDGGSSPSVFYRHTQILETGSPSERQIIVTVGWNDGIISGELDVFEYIYDFNI